MVLFYHLSSVRAFIADVSSVYAYSTDVIHKLNCISYCCLNIVVMGADFGLGYQGSLVKLWISVYVLSGCVLDYYRWLRYTVSSELLR